MPCAGFAPAVRLRLSGSRRRLSPPGCSSVPAAAGEGFFLQARRMGPARAEDVWKLLRQAGGAGGGRPRSAGWGRWFPGRLSAALRWPGAQSLPSGRCLQIPVAPVIRHDNYSLVSVFLFSCGFFLCVRCLFSYLLVQCVKRKLPHTAVSDSLVNLQIQLKAASNSIKKG